VGRLRRANEFRLIDEAGKSSPQGEVGEILRPWSTMMAAISGAMI